MTPGIWMSKLVNKVIGDLRVEKKAETDKLALIEYCTHQLHEDAMSDNYEDEFETMFDKLAYFPQLPQPEPYLAVLQRVKLKLDASDDDYDKAYMALHGFIMQSLFCLFQSGIEIDLDRVKANLKFVYKFMQDSRREQFTVCPENVLSVGELRLMSERKTNTAIQDVVALLAFGRKGVVPATATVINKAKYDATVRSSFGDAMKSTAAAKANSTKVDGRPRSDSAPPVTPESAFTRKAKKK